MQHAPINDPTRYRLQKLGMGNAPEVVREVGVHNFRMAAKQQLFHRDHRLLGVSPGTVGVEFRWKVGSPLAPPRRPVVRSLSLGRERWTRHRPCDPAGSPAKRSSGSDVRPWPRGSGSCGCRDRRRACRQGERQSCGERSLGVGHARRASDGPGPRSPDRRSGHEGLHGLGPYGSAAQRKSGSTGSYRDPGKSPMWP